ncbi:MAG: ABC-F family ATP-binding cassette domain-containing protein [Bacteroidota bacterium]|nr:ABC-F family ATP-binding cassette domain-containing protein [Bacteroidota bacterium]
MIDLNNVSLQFNGKYLFDEVNFKISSGDKISLVGANGTGKSSLLKIICGEILPESGSINKQNKITIGYLPQDNVVHSGKTLVDEAKTALASIIALHEKEEEIVEQLKEKMTDAERDDLVNQLGEVHLKLEDLDSYRAFSKVEKILKGLGFEEEDFDRLTNEFSGGWQMRIALAKILISQNDILLLDEPTNHLDIESLEWLIGYLKSYKGALLIVSHDKHFINSVTNKTLEIFLKRFYTYNGSYDDYLRYKQERDEQTEHQYVLQQKKIKETQSFIERFRYKSTKAKQVQSRIKQLEKVELIELPDSKSDINIKFPDPPSSGRINIELKELSKSYGDKEIFNKINFTVERGEKIAFIGPNGAGKSTLAKIIAGVIDFNGGERTLGYNTAISYYAQDVADSLNKEQDIIETVDEIAEDKTLGQLRTLLGSFLFTGDDVFKKVGVLSGGEKSRVALAKILLTKANFIILDEPTNHLDLSSKEVLQKALVNFSGSLILVSHDIDFLLPIVNKVIEIKKGVFKTYYGNIEYYLSKKEEETVGAELSSKQVRQNEPSSKKDQKRIEAELRQKKYAATKHLVFKLKDVESRISDLEHDEKKLETEIFAPELYNNPQLAREKNTDYQNVKKCLEEAMEEWAVLSDEIAEIEKQFQ